LDFLELDCDVQADTDRPQYFAAILANRRRLRVAWDANRSISMQTKSIRRLNARLLRVLPETKLNASGNANVH
jgi:hypothetical protein